MVTLDQLMLRSDGGFGHVHRSLAKGRNAFAVLFAMKGRIASERMRRNGVRRRGIHEPLSIVGAFRLSDSVGRIAGFATRIGIKWELKGLCSE